ncbi:MAG: hypothetical protein V4450_07445 [Bacteroidota bacterium]
MRTAPLNTGIDCQVKMVAPALYILMPASAKWTEEDEEDFLAFVMTKVHATAKDRWYPIFGNNAPVRTINDSKESDVIVTYDDGSQAFIRNGTITRTLMTNKGGLAYAQALMSFNGLRNWAFVEVDKLNNVHRKQNADGTFSGTPLNMAYAPTPDPATLKDEFKPAFSINYTADDYIMKGVISNSDENLLDLMGLINAELTDAGASTATKLKFGIRTIGKNDDLVAAYAQLADLTVVKVTNKATGAVVTPASAAVTGGHIELTGVFTAGQTFVIVGTTPAAMKALTPSVEGYEITKGVEIAIPA